MKEMSDNKFWSLALLYVLILLCTLIVSICAYNAYATRQFIEGGYVQASIPGCNGSYWVKP